MGTDSQDSAAVAAGIRVPDKLQPLWRVPKYSGIALRIALAFTAAGASILVHRYCIQIGVHGNPI